jgi:hypothetical protein
MEVTAELLPFPWLFAGWVWTFDDRRYLQN